MKKVKILIIKHLENIIKKNDFGKLRKSV